RQEKFSCTEIIASFACSAVSCLLLVSLRAQLSGNCLPSCAQRSTNSPPVLSQSQACRAHLLRLSKMDRSFTSRPMATLDLTRRLPPRLRCATASVLLASSLLLPQFCFCRNRESCRSTTRCQSSFPISRAQTK